MAAVAAWTPLEGVAASGHVAGESWAADVPAISLVLGAGCVGDVVELESHYVGGRARLGPGFSVRAVNLLEMGTRVLRSPLMEIFFFSFWSLLCRGAERRRERVFKGMGNGYFYPKT